MYLIGDFTLEDAAFLQYVLAQVVLVFQQQRVETLLRHALQSFVGRLLLALSLEVDAFLAIDRVQQALHYLHARRHSVMTRHQIMLDISLTEYTQPLIISNGQDH